ncbi:MAG: hypothetical protein WCI18_15940 [Pseudomonadota bacterium]
MLYRKFLWVCLFICLSTSCKEINLFEKEEGISEVDAVNIPKLWNWFSHYADDVANLLSRAGGWKNDVGLASRIKPFLPAEGMAEAGRILDKNKSQLPGFVAKLAALENGVYKLNKFPLTSLPGGIPGKYERAFKVLLDGLEGNSSGKISARRFSAQIVAKLAAKEKISYAQAYERHLNAFTISEFGVAPQPLPNEFANSNVFYGHLLQKKAPFLDVAFGEGGILGPDSPNAIKAAHGAKAVYLKLMQT